MLAVPLGEADNSPTAQTEFASCYAVKIGKTGAEHESDSATLAEVLQNARLAGGSGGIGDDARAMGMMFRRRIAPPSCVLFEEIGVHDGINPRIMAGEFMD